MTIRICRRVLLENWQILSCIRNEKYAEPILKLFIEFIEMEAVL